MEGARLGPYRILAELGSGGMGKVYRAEVTKAAAGLEVGTSVALKVIHAHLLEQEGFFQRFLREADIGRSVQHENVVKTYVADALLHEGVQQNFLVMEYVQGQTLRGLLNELERVPEELCRHIGREVAKGLAAIHAAGVVHRDLKPENVLITEDHVVKVMDLGVARLQDEAMRLSQAGAFVGSLDYAAPEQFGAGECEPDERADLYALGVLLYELSAGQHPHAAEDVTSLLRSVLEVTPRPLGSVNPQLSPFFEEVVHKLLAKRPEERFARASEVARVLQEGEPGAWWRGRARALRAETRRPLRRIRIPRGTALYGRERDLAELQALYEQAKRGDGQVLLIEGEAGIGKTRLVDEFVGRLLQEGEDIHFLFGSYPPGGAATPAGAFNEAYREQFGAEGLEETLREYLKPTPSLVPAFAALLKGETTPTGAEPLTKDSLQTVFVHATRGLASERPTVVLIDDLHFAPDDGRALFTSLAMSVPGHRVLLLGAMRPGVPKDWTANVERQEQTTLSVLSRLGPKDLANLLEDAFRSRRLAEELGIQIARKSDGNPFFALEIIRGLREGQFISQRPDGVWVSTKLIENIQVPSSVVDLVNARVADLSEIERDLLDVASCFGFEFDPLLLAGVAGREEIETLRRLGHIEKKHRLVRSSGRKFVFDHHQVQEALYGGLSDPLRERYHAAIAEFLEQWRGAVQGDAGQLDGAFCVDLCEHFLKGAQGERALDYLDAALDYLAGGFLNDQAVALADFALDTPNLLRGERRLEILLRKDERLSLLGRRDAQEAVLAECREIAAQSDVEALLAKVEGALGSLRWLTGRTEEALAHFQRTLALAAETGDRRAEGKATGNVGVALLRLGRYDEAQVHFERSRDLARANGDRRSEAIATGNLGAVFLYLGRFDEAQAQCERHLAISREIKDRRVEAYATAVLGEIHWSLGRYAEAGEYMEQSLALSRETGDRSAEANALLGLANVHLAAEEYGAARSHYLRSLELLRAIGDRELEGRVTGNLGHLLYLLGSRAEAREYCERQLALGRDVAAPTIEVLALLNLALLHMEDGDVQEAARLSDEAHARRRRLGDTSQATVLLIQQGEIRWRVGDLDGAREALQEAADLSRQQRNAADLSRALAALACLAGGDAGAAEAALEQAGAGGNKPDVRYYLWKATGTHEHLAEAKRLLDHRVEHAPEDCREPMLANVRLHREITEAWASTAPKAAKRGGGVPRRTARDEKEA